MDAWREGEEFIVEFDLPGIKDDSLDLDIERNVVTVRAERPGIDPGREMLATERPRGVFSRQLVLGENLDTEKIDATYDGGVLRLRIPVAERAKPRKIAVEGATVTRSSTPDRPAGTGSDGLSGRCRLTMVEVAGGLATTYAARPPAQQAQMPAADWPRRCATAQPVPAKPTKASGIVHRRRLPRAELQDDTNSLLGASWLAIGIC